MAALRESLRMDAESPVSWLACVVRGHRWDVEPRRRAKHIKCVRCGMTAEPVSPNV